ncbi:MAG: hypothetical protein WBW61_05190 [Rhodanobacteraceae bacterium]
MIFKPVLASLCMLAAAGFIVPAAQADTLRTRHAHHARHAYRSNVPVRGMTMAQVERRYGAPLEKLPTAGGDTPRHPPIHRWRYTDYTVYFERNLVLHTVWDRDLAERGRSVR